MIARWTRLAFAVCVFAGGPLPAAAHPHVFVDATVSFQFDESGKLTTIRLDWIYDDLFSLMLTEDLGVDADGDLVLTADDQAKLDAGVLDWPADYNGDLFLTQGDAPLALSGPVQHSVNLDQGRVHEKVARVLIPAADPTRPIVIRLYDPSLYVAYTIKRSFDLPTGCTLGYVAADIDAANAKVSDMLGGMMASDVPADQTMPDVGDLFADTMTLTCAAS